MHPAAPKDRREFLVQSLGLAASTTLGATLGGALVQRASGQAAVSRGALPPYGEQLAPVQLELRARVGSAQILPGVPTTVWRYTGRQIGGPPGALLPLGGSHLGPILRFTTGQRALIRLSNELPEEHVAHWHGLDVPEAMDGHPRCQFPSGGSYLYDFTVLNRAGTYWYHSHTDMRTGYQAYMGLAGPLIVGDDEERALDLPSGALDLPLVLQDANFDANNQLQFAPLNMQNGFIGNTILVNGRANFVLNAATRVHRMRVVNGSTARVYKLAWSDGTPMVAIANDGGLLAAPLALPYVTLAPGERVELWVDFRGKPLGAQITLQSLAFSGVSNAQGAPIDVLRAQIVRVLPETRQLPATLSSIQLYNPQQALNYGNPRTFPISMLTGGGGFTLNGALFQMLAVAPNEIVQRDTLEIVRITNTSGMMQVGHPIHFHGRQFQILSRSVTAAGLPNWQTLNQGFVDAGWKDTFLILPGETVDILVRWSKFTGMFLYHCHNLVHEDMGMMRNVRIDP
jgi:blue copper oxidase